MAADATGPIRSSLAADPDFRELLRAYVESLRAQQADLQAAFAAGQFDRLGRLAHQIKGSGGGYGFDQLSATAAALEKACTACDSDAELIGRELDRLCESIGSLSISP